MRTVSRADYGRRAACPCGRLRTVCSLHAEAFAVHRCGRRGELELLRLRLWCERCGRPRLHELRPAGR